MASARPARAAAARGHHRLSLLSPRRRTDLGKRAGVTAGLFGLLAVCAQLCFLFPDVLVSRDLRPLYVENLSLVRGLVHGVMVATFVLATLSILWLRSRGHGAIGLVLGGVAVALGASQPVTVAPGTTRGLTVGLDYFVLELFLLGLVFVPMERLFFLRRQKIFRTGWQTDLLHFFVSHAGVQVMSFLTLIPVQVALGFAEDWSVRAAVAAQPLWLQFVEILLAVDLVTYWVHRAFHQVPFLWSFHAIHHSSRQMDWLAGSRIHLFDAVVTRALGFAPIFALGFAAPALYAYLLFVSFHAVYIHANVRHRWPRLRWVLATPEFHHWHHTSDEEGLDKNFAAFLPALDVVFGTAHLPDRWPARYGTVTFQPPESWTGQLAYPFRRRPAATPYG